MTQTHTYLCDDGNAEVEYEAESAADAAQQYVDDGDWGECSATSWVDVYVQRVTADGSEIGDREMHTITIEPEEPPCTEDEHDWQRPIEIVGGISENPGVQGHGGGVYATEVCMHCGCARVTDTWAQRSDTGEQGLRSVEYEPERYLDEIERLRERDAN